MSRESRRRSEQLKVAAATIYVVALLLAFVVVIFRTIPPGSIPAIQAIVVFLGILASLLLVLSQLIGRRDDDRL